MFEEQCKFGEGVHSAALRARGLRPSLPLVWTTPHFHASGNKSGKGWREGGRERFKKKNKCRKKHLNL